jgi:hypothetical protein
MIKCSPVKGVQIHGLDLERTAYSKFLTEVKDLKLRAKM